MMGQRPDAKATGGIIAEKDGWSDLSIDSATEQGDKDRCADSSSAAAGDVGNLPSARGSDIWLWTHDLEASSPRNGLGAGGEHGCSSDKPATTWKGSSVLHKQFERASRLLGSRQATGSGQLTDASMENVGRTWSSPSRRALREDGLEQEDSVARRKSSLVTLGSGSRASLDLFECFATQRQPPPIRRRSSSVNWTSSRTREPSKRTPRPELKNMNITASASLQFSALSCQEESDGDCEAASGNTDDIAHPPTSLAEVSPCNETPGKEATMPAGLSESSQTTPVNCDNLGERTLTVTCSSGPSRIDLLQVDHMLRSKLHRHARRSRRSGDRAHDAGVQALRVERSSTASSSAWPLHRALSPMPPARHVARFHSLGRIQPTLTSAVSELGTWSKRKARRISSFDALQTAGSRESFLKRSLSRSSGKSASPSRRLACGRAQHHPWNGSHRDVVLKLRRAVRVIQPDNATLGIVGHPLDSITERDNAESSLERTAGREHKEPFQSHIFRMSSLTAPSEWSFIDTARSAEGSSEQNKQEPTLPSGVKKSNRLAPLAGLFQLGKAGRSRADGKGKSGRLRSSNAQPKHEQQMDHAVGDAKDCEGALETELSRQMSMADVASVPIPASRPSPRNAVGPQTFENENTASPGSSNVLVATNPCSAAEGLVTVTASSDACPQTCINSQGSTTPNGDGLLDIPLTDCAGAKASTDGSLASVASVERSATPPSVLLSGVETSSMAGSVELDFVPLRPHYWVPSSAPSRQPSPSFSSQSGGQGRRSLLANVQNFFGLNTRVREGFQSTGYWRRRRQRHEPSSFFFDDQLTAEMNEKKLPLFPVLSLPNRPAGTSSIKVPPVSLSQHPDDPWTESAGPIASARRHSIPKQLSPSRHDGSPEGQPELFTPLAMGEGLPDSSSPAASVAREADVHEAKMPAEAEGSGPRLISSREKSNISTGGFLRLFMRRKRDAVPKSTETKLEREQNQQRSDTNDAARCETLVR